MQKISTHLWFDTQAKEAAAFYTSTFKDSSIKSSAVLHGTPSGEVDMLTIDLSGQEFTLISAGPYFKLNPAISFLVACKTKEEVDTLWHKLIEGGSAMMELGSYPFSEKYGWLKDKFGVTWQIMYVGDREVKQVITPTLMFVGDLFGKAEEAVNFYVSVFHDASIGHVMRYDEMGQPDEGGAVSHESFTLEGVEFAAMDGAGPHAFTFNEAISFMVHCDTQAEIDYYWEKLSADPKAEQCGWLKDKYTVSWQIVPTVMDKMMKDGTQEQIARVTQAFLQMKKFDIAKLQEAYDHA